jgi:hypothetical protein
VGQVLYPAENDKILISKEGHDLKKKREMNILPLNLGGSQALIQDKEDVLAQ